MADKLLQDYGEQNQYVQQNRVTTLPLGCMAYSASDTIKSDRTGQVVPFYVIPTGAGSVVVTPWFGAGNITLTYATDGTGLFPGTPVPFMCRAIVSTTIAQVLIGY